MKHAAVLAKPKWLRSPQKPTKGPQSTTPGPKGTPKRTPRSQISPKKNPKKDLKRRIFQERILNIRYQILDHRYEYRTRTLREERSLVSYFRPNGHPCKSLDTKYAVCGGTREALAIRRTLFDGQCSKACELVFSILGL